MTTLSNRLKSRLARVGGAYPGGKGGRPSALRSLRGRARWVALAGASLSASLTVGALGGCAELLEPEAPEAFTELAVGAYHSCAVSTDGAVWCWGRGDDGALGSGDTRDRAWAAPTAMPTDGTRTFTRVAAALTYSCALDDAGASYCWGTEPLVVPGGRASVPTRVAGAPAFVEIAAGTGHACGLTPAGEVFCWGSNEHGQLGRGNGDPDGVPGPVVGGRRYTAISAGGRHTCGLAEGGEPFCWGANESFQLGLGDWTRMDRWEPTLVGGEHRFTAIDAGSLHTCALDGTQHGWCWGAANDGQIGDYAYLPDRAPQPAPALVGGTVGDWPLASIRAGHRVSCGVYGLTRRQGACWGNGEYGQLGIGRTGDQGGPQLVTLHPGHMHNSDGLQFRVVDPGGVRHTCGLSVEGALLCWGSGEEGQLGGDVAFTAFPRLVELAR